MNDIMRKQYTSQLLKFVCCRFVTHLAANVEGVAASHMDEISEHGLDLR